LVVWRCLVSVYERALVRREAATLGGSDPHEKIIVVGPKVRRLKKSLEHYT
jgi:hypothetical protein